MQLKDLFMDDFQEVLNDANTAMESLVMVANAMLQEGKTLDEINARVEQELKPVGDELEVSFKVRTFVFPTLVVRKKNGN